MSHLRYEMGSYIPEDILHSRRHDNLKSYRSRIITNNYHLLFSLFPVTSLCNYPSTRSFPYAIKRLIQRRGIVLTVHVPLSTGSTPIEHSKRGLALHVVSEHYQTFVTWKSM
jgi:hypothetical protein